LPTIRIDGNDRARHISLAEGRPVLIEAMTYRVGAHSTSDDDSKYRNPHAPEAGWDSERAYWEARSPIIRFGRYLHAKGWWNAQMEEDLRKSSRQEAIGALNDAASAPKPRVGELFSDVYDELPWMLAEQSDAVADHMDRYHEHYAHVRR